MWRFFGSKKQSQAEKVARLSPPALQRWLQRAGLSCVRSALEGLSGNSLVALLLDADRAASLALSRSISVVSLCALMTVLEVGDCDLTRAKLDQRSYACVQHVARQRTATSAPAVPARAVDRAVACSDSKHTAAVPPVFVSFQAFESLGIATEVKAILEERGVPSFLCGTDAEGAVLAGTLAALAACELVVVLVSPQYGQDPVSGTGTSRVVSQIISLDKPIVCVRLSESCGATCVAEMSAQVQELVDGRRVLAGDGHAAALCDEISDAAVCALCQTGDFFLRKDVFHPVAATWLERAAEGFAVEEGNVCAKWQGEDSPLVAGGNLRLVRMVEQARHSPVAAPPGASRPSTSADQSLPDGADSSCIVRPKHHPIGDARDSAQDTGADARAKSEAVACPEAPWIGKGKEASSPEKAGQRNSHHAAGSESLSQRQDWCLHKVENPALDDAMSFHTGARMVEDFLHSSLPAERAATPLWVVLGNVFLAFCNISTGSSWDSVKGHIADRIYNVTSALLADARVVLSHFSEIQENCGTEALEVCCVVADAFALACLSQAMADHVSSTRATACVRAAHYLGNFASIEEALSSLTKRLSLFHAAVRGCREARAVRPAEIPASSCTAERHPLRIDQPATAKLRNAAHIWRCAGGGNIVRTNSLVNELFVACIRDHWFQCVADDVEEAAKVALRAAIAHGHDAVSWDQWVQFLAQAPSASAAAAMVLSSWPGRLALQWPSRVPQRYGALSDASPAGMRAKLYKRLSPVDFGADLVTLQRRFLPGTRQPLLDAYDAWVHLPKDAPRRRIFWLHAPPGFGKSVFAAQLVRRWPSDARNAACQPAAWYFWGRNLAERQTSSAFLCTLAYQLACHSETFCRALAGQRERDARSASQDRVRDAADLFELVVAAPLRDALQAQEQPQEFVVVLDGVDQVPVGVQRMRVLQVIVRRILALPQCVRLVLTCCPAADICDALLRQEPTVVGNLDAIHVSDLARVARASLSDIFSPAFGGGTPNDVIVDTVVKAARGSFLTLKLVCDAVKRHVAADCTIPLLARLNESSDSPSTLCYHCIEDLFSGATKAIASVSHGDSKVHQRLCELAQNVVSLLLVLRAPLRWRDICTACDILNPQQGAIVRTLLNELLLLLYPALSLNRIEPADPALGDLILASGQRSTSLQVSTALGHQLAAKACAAALYRSSGVDARTMGICGHHSASLDVYAWTQGHLHALKVCTLDSLAAIDAMRTWADAFVVDRVLGAGNGCGMVTDKHVLAARQASLLYGKWIFEHVFEGRNASRFLAGLLQLATGVSSLQELPGFCDCMLALARILRDTQRLFSVHYACDRTASDVIESVAAHLPITSEIYASEAWKYLVQRSGADACACALPASSSTGPLLLTLSGHRGRVETVAVAGSGRLLVSAGEDTAVRVWDADCGALAHTFHGHKGPVAALTVTANDERALSGDALGWLWFWDLHTGEAVASLHAHSGAINSVASAAVGNAAATGGADGTIHLWDVERARLKKTLHTGDSAVLAIAFGPTSEILAASIDNATVCMWSAADYTLVGTLRADMGRARSIAWSAKGDRIAVGSWNSSIYVWDVQKQSLLQTVRIHTGKVHSIAWQPQGHRLASAGEDGNVCVWDTRAGAKVATCAGHLSSVFCVAWCPSGRRMVSGSWDETVRLWDVAGDWAPARGRGHVGRVFCAAYSPDARRLASGGEDRLVLVWSEPDCAIVRELRGHTGRVLSVAFHASGQQVASGSDDESVRVWDVESGAVLNTLRALGGEIPYVAIDQASNGLMYLCCSASGVVVHSINGADTVISPTEGVEGPLSAATRCVVANRVAAACAEHAVHVWDARTGAVVCSLRGHTESVVAIAFDAVGARLVSGGYDQSVRVWNIDTNACDLVLRGHTEWITAVAWSPDGRQVVSGSYDETLCVWDAQTGSMLHRPRGHSDAIWALAYTPDGRRLASGGGDGLLLLWDA